MPKKRPLILTILCILAFVGLIGAAPLIFSNTAKAIGSWYPPYLGFSTVVGLITFVGLWRMKKWSVILYTLFVGINQIVFLIAGLWTVSALLIPLAVVFIGFYYYKSMD